jgi:predicted nuclease with TOPRIM domain
MTLFSPTLTVRRLVILKDATTVYDEHFHAGVNIIRGENSSGKSTVLNILVHGLGGDISQWSEHALLCTRVLVEVELNGKVATLSREIARATKRPMDIFGGTVDAAMAAGITEWRRYPYLSSEGKQSFSQAIFALLDLPEVQTEASGKLTMHQLLRLIYSDQLSPVENIFRFERFDAPIVREAVGRLLCGAYHAEIYENEIRIRALEKEQSEVASTLTSIYSVLGGVQHSLNEDWAAAREKELRQTLRSVETEIEAAEEQLFVDGNNESFSLTAQRTAFVEVQTLQANVSAIRRDIEELELETADSDTFIASLQTKLIALKDAGLVSDEIGSVDFLWCPSCYATLDRNVGDHACHLCKSPFDDERLKTRIINLTNDVGIQLRQSTILQKERQRLLQELHDQERVIENKWHSAAERLAALQRTPSSDLRSRLRTLNQRAGYVQREIEDVQEKAGLIEQLGRLSARKAEIAGELSDLTDRNASLAASERDRLSKAYTEIADRTREFLRADLPRQEAFQQAREISFSFGSDKISVNGESYFSASSLVILKNSFLAGFLFAATDDRKFRHPRLAILDTVEDKGMEPERSRNFQKLLVTASEAAKVEHQIIFATAMIASELDNPTYTIGSFSSHDDRTLSV